MSGSELLRRPSLRERRLSKVRFDPEEMFSDVASTYTTASESSRAYQPPITNSYLPSAEIPPLRIQRQSDYISDEISPRSHAPPPPQHNTHVQPLRIQHYQTYKPVAPPTDAHIRDAPLSPRSRFNGQFNPMADDVPRSAPPVVGRAMADSMYLARRSLDSGIARTQDRDPYTMLPKAHTRSRPMDPYAQAEAGESPYLAQAATFAGSDETLNDHRAPPLANPLPYPGYVQPTAANGQPIKPAIRRSQTEDDIWAELARGAARDAATIVHTHVNNARPKSRLVGIADGLEPPEGRSTGVLSNLLQLYGTSTPNLRRTISSQTTTTMGGRSVAPSRSNSIDTLAEKPTDVNDYFPRSLSQGFKRPSLARSAYSYRTNNDDAASSRSLATLRSLKPLKLFRRNKSFQNDAEAVYDELSGRKKALSKKSKKEQRRLEITLHVADILQRHNFILKLAKALMTFGSPSHRLESQLAATAEVLQVDAEFVHLPNVVIASFSDENTHTSETHFVKAKGGLNLGQLHRVHMLYRNVVHDKLGVQEASVVLSKMLKEKPTYSILQRILIAFVCAGVIGPLGFGGSFIDAWVSAGMGAVLAFLQLHAASKNAMYSNIFEISIATMFSFLARALSRTNLFCYEAISSAGVVLILPGYVILCGSLELASKNIISGSVRMVYAIIYSLFLGFGIAIGSDMYYLFDPSARAAVAIADGFSFQGTFVGAQSIANMTGTFTFTNTTMSATESALRLGAVTCARNPEWQWWRQSMSNNLWLLLLVPVFSLFLSLWNLQPLKSKDLLVMVIISCIGFTTNLYGNHYIFNRSDVVSFLGAFVIGMLGNIYARVFKGTAFTVMSTGVLFLVPSGIAAAGGLAMTENKSGDSYSNGLIIGFRMVQVAIGITVGLFFSSFVVYSFGRQKRAALFAF